LAVEVIENTLNQIANPADSSFRIMISSKQVLMTGAQARRLHLESNRDGCAPVDEV
jgi:hypothetical protein